MRLRTITTTSAITTSAVTMTAAFLAIASLAAPALAQPGTQTVRDTPAPPTDTPPTVKLHGWASIGLAGHWNDEAPGALASDPTLDAPLATVEDPTGFGAFLGMARLKAAARLSDITDLTAQVEAASGQARLLDVWLRVGLGDLAGGGLALRAGQSKVPLSREFLISLPSHPFARRALLVDHVHRRRLGVDLRYDSRAALTTGEEVHVIFDVGLYNAGDAQSAADAGGMVVARGELEVYGFDLHLAWGQQLTRLSTVEDSGLRTHQLDAALAYDRDGWHLLAEALLTWDRTADLHALGRTPAVNDGALLALHTSVGKALRVPGWQRWVEPEPVLGFDQVDDARSAFGVRRRISAGVDLNMQRGHITPMLHYERAIDLRGVGHSVFAQLRGGF